MKMQLQMNVSYEKSMDRSIAIITQQHNTVLSRRLTVWHLETIFMSNQAHHRFQHIELIREQSLSGRGCWKDCQMKKKSLPIGILP